MIRRWPPVATAVVALAVLAMIALGIWQLDRRTQKEAFLSLLASNVSAEAVEFPAYGPVADEDMFRPSSLDCLTVTGWRSDSGRSLSGMSGHRYIAECATGGGEALVVVGVTDQLIADPQWAGGPVSGITTTEPDRRSLIGRMLWDERVLQPMLVASDAIPGFERPSPPTPETIPNNHLAYAVQWFLFAGLAALIYVLALRGRQRG